MSDTEKEDVKEAACDHYSLYRDHEGDEYCRKCGSLVNSNED